MNLAFSSFPGVSPALTASRSHARFLAERLDLGLKTVRNHVSDILHKLQVADRQEAIIRALEAGLGESDR